MGYLTGRAWDQAPGSSGDEEEIRKMRSEQKEEGQKVNILNGRALTTSELHPVPLPVFPVWT